MGQDELVFRILLGLILITFVSHRAYYTRKYQIKSEDIQEKSESSTAQRFASLLALLGLIATIVYIVNPAWIAWASLPLPDWLRWLGLIIVIAGFGLLQWSQNTLGANWSDAARLMEDHQMVTDGPYRRIRHPIYTSFLLILCPTILISANWLVGGLWILMMAIDINARIQTEERLLITRYGDRYRQYMGETGRVLPRF